MQRLHRPSIADHPGSTREPGRAARVEVPNKKPKESVMGFGRGILLWLLGVPLPIIILLALFWHH